MCIYSNDKNNSSCIPEHNSTDRDPQGYRIHSGRRYLPFSNRSICCKIWLDDILIVQKEQRATNIVTSECTLRTYNDFSQIEACLDGRFYHSLKYTLINIDRLVRVSDCTAEFDNGFSFELGREGYVRIKQVFARRLFMADK